MYLINLGKCPFSNQLVFRTWFVFKNNGSHHGVLLFLPYVWVLIELEAPDVDTKMKTESLVDSRARGCASEEGMSSCLDVRGRIISFISRFGSAVCLSPLW